MLLPAYSKSFGEPARAVLRNSRPFLRGTEIIYPETFSGTSTSSDGSLPTVRTACGLVAASLLGPDKGTSPETGGLLLHAP